MTPPEQENVPAWLALSRQLKKLVLPLSVTPTLSSALVATTRVAPSQNAPKLMLPSTLTTSAKQLACAPQPNVSLLKLAKLDKSAPTDLPYVPTLHALTKPPLPSAQPSPALTWFAETATMTKVMMLALTQTVRTTPTTFASHQALAR